MRKRNTEFILGLIGGIIGFIVAVVTAIIVLTATLFGEKATTGGNMIAVISQCGAILFPILGIVGSVVVRKRAKVGGCLMIISAVG